MSDIVERLRWNARSEEDRFSRKTCEEAAHEIERLRAALREIADHRIDSKMASQEKRGMALRALALPVVAGTGEER
jgi:hypothetical protein